MMFEKQNIIQKLIAESVVNQEPSYKNKLSRLLSGLEAFEKTPLTDKECHDINTFFYQSYLFAQGYSPLQNLFFSYFRKTEPSLYRRLKHSTKYDHSKMKQLFTITIPRGHSASAGIPSGDKIFERDESQSFLYLDVEKKTAKQEIIARILEKMIERDEAYQKRSRSIPLQNDLHFSYIRHYALRGEGRCHRIFKSLFTELQPLISDTNAQLRQLSKLWEEKHPGQSFWRSN